MNNYARRYANKRNINAEPGVGDINIMIKPSTLKDKTPMCLVNELARFNKIQHQYRLTKEEGPPHRKKFTVTLKLGDTEFEAQGTSIKKAQHEAAAIALRSTKYKHPPPKLLPNTKVNTTPTVELNALAMKRGEPTIYTMLSQPIPTYYHQRTYPVNYYAANNIYQNRTLYEEYCYNEYTVMNSYPYPGTQYNNARYKCMAPFKISLKVGSREFIAEGTSAQLARHNAAKKALEDLRDTVSEYNKIDYISNINNNPEVLDRFSDDSKSPISAVHEKAFRHNLQAKFEVTDERGPPHIRTFITECRVGNEFKTVGEGNGKKISKRKAAENMLELLRTIPAPPKPSINIDKRRIRKKISINKKKTCVVKDYEKQTDSPETNTESQDSNPVTKLMEYQKKKKYGKEPVYVLVDEKGRGRKRQFTIEVKVDDLKHVGIGNSKKNAKRQASEGMLKLLGLKTKVNENSVDISEITKNKNEINSEMPTVNGKQIAPGLLLVRNANITPKPISKKCSVAHQEVYSTMNGTTNHNTDESPPEKQQQPQYTSAKHKFFTNMNIQRNIAKEQLLRLADTFGYEVQFSDFPKGHHHQEFLSLVTLNTNPPQTYYGSGDSTETAQNEAAFNALSMVSEMGVENLFSKKISSYIPSEKEIASQ